MPSATDTLTDPPLSTRPAGARLDAAIAEHRRLVDASDEVQVRAVEQEPYVGLKYLSRLFKLMAVVLVLLLVSEVITGFVVSGMDALPTLLGEVSRLIVFAGLLWGCGDLAMLFVDIGHDLRATRILIGRQLAHHMNEHHYLIDPAVASSPQSEPPDPLSS